jgi:hypothetical protein
VRLGDLQVPRRVHTMVPPAHHARARPGVHAQTQCAPRKHLSIPSCLFICLFTRKTLSARINFVCHGHKKKQQTCVLVPVAAGGCCAHVHACAEERTCPNVHVRGLMHTPSRPLPPSDKVESLGPLLVSNQLENITATLGRLSDHLKHLLIAQARGDVDRLLKRSNAAVIPVRVRGEHVSNQSESEKHSISHGMSVALAVARGAQHSAT